jgi:hypothetical protein
MKRWTILLVFYSISATYVLVAKSPYTGARTCFGVFEGPDVNVPYNNKFGILGYAYERDYYKNGIVVEHRIEEFSVVRLAASIFGVIGVWAGTLYLIFGLPNRERGRAIESDSPDKSSTNG